MGDKDGGSAKEDGTGQEGEPVNNQGSTPSVSSFKITQADRFVLMCSDGVWECIESEGAVSIVGAFKPSQAMEAAEELTRIAYDRWIKKFQGQVVDDITALVINLVPQLKGTAADAAVGG